MSQISQNDNSGEIVYSYCKAEKERIDSYQVVIGSVKELAPALSKSSLVRNLFFKKLCKEIENFEIKKYLDYHFQVYQGDKVFFLDTVKEDMSELFNKLMSPFSLPDFNDKKIIVDHIPLFGPYDYSEAKLYGDRHLKLREWTEIKGSGLLRDKPKVSKSYKLWNDNIESIKTLRSLLMDDDFIDEIDEVDFITNFSNELFNVLINWTDDISVLIRLMDKLKPHIHHKYLTGKENLPSPTKLSRHFTLNGEPMTEKELRQSRSDIKGTLIRKEEIIDTIVREVKKISRH